MKLQEKKELVIDVLPPPSPRKVCLLKASSERERDRKRDGGSEKITLVKIEENDDEGNREDVEDAERES